MSQHAYQPGGTPPGVSLGFSSTGLEQTDLETLLNLGAAYADENNLAGAQEVAEELIRRGLVDTNGEPTPEGLVAFKALDPNNKEASVPNPETTRRIEVIDMALSFGADPETSMPLTDEKRRLLEQEKALLQGGSTPEEVKEGQSLADDEADVIRLLMGTQPTPEAAAINDVTNLVEPESAPAPTQSTYLPGGGGVPAEPVQTPVQTPEQEATTSQPTPQPVATQPVTAPQPTPEAPSLAETVKNAVSESLAQLLGTGGGSSSLDDLLSKLDPRDSESALKMFTWLWENHRFQVIGQLNGGGYLLHYAEPKGTSQAGYIPGGTKGGRMVDQALQAAKDNPAAAHRGMCPQCMSAVKQIVDTGQVLSDDGTDNPNCPAGGNHAFAG